MAFLADELQGVEEVPEAQSVQNGWLLGRLFSLGGDRRLRIKVVRADQMPRVFVETDGFKPQLSLGATSSQHFYVFQHQLNAGHDSDEKPLYSDTPDEGGVEMFQTKHLKTARMLGMAVIALSLGACATHGDVVNINSRLDSLDAKVQGAAQSAEAANQSAQQANQRLDQIEGRVQQLEMAKGRQPRG